ncbi:tail protein X [Brevibacillus composti]|uniref:Tail protein X n=1 Tax=Brevibacillus composti TaxID=2796470 RepID=A0A7T5EN86_9BACL|nr:tail protein X [Brevibacillus composti]QQE75724.1 tail protein X [Brevibacillus composti]QUO42750.1 tail protein X [Brevibacillus composti]
MRTYVTVQGDMWDGIAKKTLGSEYYMTALIDANPRYREIVIFPANLQLNIPDAPAATVPSDLPPWKRGDTT